MFKWFKENNVTEDAHLHHNLSFTVIYRMPSEFLKEELKIIPTPLNHILTRTDTYRRVQNLERSTHLLSWINSVYFLLHEGEVMECMTTKIWWQSCDHKLWDLTLLNSLYTFILPICWHSFANKSLRLCLYPG